MRYRETLNLWDWKIQRKVISGEIKLQRGQWIKCGNPVPSRFVGVSDNGVIWAIHPDGSKGTTGERFRDACKLFKVKSENDLTTRKT